MSNFQLNVKELITKGYSVFENIYDEAQVAGILNRINETDKSGTAFRKTSDLFAIRQLLKEVPAVRQLIFTEKLLEIICQTCGPDYFVIKSIYFDKPEQSNWFVAWHQDLTISVDKRKDLDDFGAWTEKQKQFTVQPPLHLLETIFTIRIHLDDTDENNGALKVIPGSHLKGIQRIENLEFSSAQIETCKVKRGGVMIMRPLLLHASNRSTVNKSRRVIHIELTNQKLPGGLEWREYFPIEGENIK